MSTAKFARFRPGDPIDTVAAVAIGAGTGATIPAVAAKFAYCTGFEVSWSSDGTGTVADTLVLAPTQSAWESLSWKVVTIAGQGGHMVVSFPDPIRCKLVNTDMGLAFSGVANRASALVVMHGFYL